eukprot:952737-Rhodomonas_salina.2
MSGCANAAQLRGNAPAISFPAVIGGRRPDGCISSLRFSTGASSYVFATASFHLYCSRSESKSCSII